MATLGKRIKEAREAAELSQDDIAGLFGISREAVSQWESDKTAPSRAKLPILASALRTSVQWLITGEQINESVRISPDDEESPGESGRSKQETGEQTEMTRHYKIALRWLQGMPEDVQERFIDDLLTDRSATRPRKTAENP